MFQYVIGSASQVFKPLWCHEISRQLLFRFEWHHLVIYRLLSIIGSQRSHEENASFLSACDGLASLHANTFAVIMITKFVTGTWRVQFQWKPYPFLRKKRKKKGARVFRFDKPTDRMLAFKIYRACQWERANIMSYKYDSTMCWLE